MNRATDLSPVEGLEPASTRRGTLLGQFRLLARLGHGGMAEVYLAVAQGAMNVNRLVVVKRLRDEQSDDEASCEMFLSEARLAARLAHPNVVQTFEAGNEDGRYYLAMEYIDGQPMSRVLTALRRAGTPMLPKLAARICADALQGLHYAHEATDFDGSPLSIVHRDVSPQNIMLTYDGVVKIVDFGIAKAACTAQTEHGIFKGKVAFMAPEQLRGGAVDRRVDVFAAGIVLWETLTGQRLFADETPAATLFNLVNQPIPRPSEIRPEIPPALDEVVVRALQRDVDQRYPTAREMRDALESFIAEEGGVRAEQIGELVTELFAETRSEVRNEIKTQLAALAMGRGGRSLGNAATSGTHLRVPSITLLDLGDVGAGNTAASSSNPYGVLTTGAVFQPSRTRRVAFVAWVGITLAAVVVSAVALVRSEPPAVTPPAPATAMAAPAPVVQEAPASGETAAPPLASAQGSTRAAPAWHPSSAARPANVAGGPGSTATGAVRSTSKAAASASAPKPAEPPPGRTFRRDL